MDKFLKAVGTLAILIGLICYRMFIVTKVWALTLVPYGLPQITFTQAIGVSFVLSAFMTGFDGKPTDEKSTMVKAISTAISLTLLWGIVALFY